MLEPVVDVVDSGSLAEEWLKGSVLATEAGADVEALLLERYTQGGKVGPSCQHYSSSWIFIKASW
jgi:hypothetical protein